MRGDEENKLICSRQGLRKRKANKVFLDILIHASNSMQDSQALSALEQNIETKQMFCYKCATKDIQLLHTVKY